MLSYDAPNEKDDEFMKIALEEARLGLKEGGIPIGACLVIDGKVVGRGHNRRVQKQSPILHGEMDCFEHAGRLKAADYKKATLYTTLSPCDMCTGAILLFGIPRVVMAENRNFVGGEAQLMDRGVELVNLDLPEAEKMLRTFIAENTKLWDEDISV